LVFKSGGGGMKLKKEEIEEEITLRRRVAWGFIGVCATVASLFFLTGLEVVKKGRFSLGERVFCIFVAAGFIGLAVGIYFTDRSEAEEMRRTGIVKICDIGPFPES